jgi:DNA modification methylase
MSTANLIATQASKTPATASKGLQMTDYLNKCHFGDCIETMRGMPAGIVQTCVTSPPYFGLRDYGHDGQIGLEATPDEFIGKLVEVFREVKRVLRDDGTLWLNIGDSYASTGTTRPARKSGNNFDNVTADGLPNPGIPDGLKPKDLIGIPWLLAFALRADGWYLRQEIIWHKPNPMPESVTDRCTKSHESIFLLAKSEKYYCDMAAIAEKSMGRELFGNSRSKGDCEQRQDNDRQDMTPTETRNKRSVWTVATTPYKGAHFATFPTALIEPCILAGAPAGGVVLDPFFGSGTTGQVAQALGRKFIGCELNPAYKALQDERLQQPSFDFAEAA